MSDMKKSNRKFRSLKMESLEKRELMAANVWAGLSSGGALEIKGTDGKDVVSVQLGIWQGKSQIEVKNSGKVVKRFEPTDVRSISASLLGGNDYIAVTLPSRELESIMINLGNGTDESVVITGNIGTVTIDAKTSIKTGVSVRDSNIRNSLFADFGSDNARDTFESRKSTFGFLDLKMGGGNDDVHLWEGGATSANIDLGAGNDGFRNQNSVVSGGRIDGGTGSNTWRGSRYANVSITNFKK